MKRKKKKPPIVVNQVTEALLVKNAESLIERRESLLKKMPGLSLSHKVKLLEGGFMGSHDDEELCEILKVSPEKLQNLKRINAQNAKITFKEKVIDAKYTTVTVAHQRLVQIKLLQDEMTMDAPDPEKVERIKVLLHDLNECAPVSLVAQLGGIVKDLGGEDPIAPAQTNVINNFSPGVAAAEALFEKMQRGEIVESEIVQPPKLEDNKNAE